MYFEVIHYISRLYAHNIFHGMVGKLLREAEPELMDSLIQATKDGDQSVFQHLLGNEIVVDDEDDGEEEIAEEDEEEV